MIKAYRAAFATLTTICVVGSLGCGHTVPRRVAQPSQASLAYAKEAGAFARVATEEDYFEAKMVYDALPLELDARHRLRGILLEYLLAPMIQLSAHELRRNPGMLGAEDDVERTHDSFREAISLFAAEELWSTTGVPITVRERQLLVESAKLLVGVYSPRGNELPVATGLFVLIAVDGATAEWTSRLQQLFSWLESGAQLSASQQGPRRLTTPKEVLEGVAAVWPTADVVERLVSVLAARQDKVNGILRRPLGLGEGARGLLSELLLDTESLSNMSVTIASTYLRCGQIDKASDVIKRFADKPGDDPEFRQLVENAQKPNAKVADFLALARRLLPRNDLLRGTSTDRIDPAAAMGVIRRGARLDPRHAELLLLASRVARMLSEPLLALRYLDEAIAEMTAGGSATKGGKNTEGDQLADLAEERLDLLFVRLKMSMDPDRMARGQQEAERLRAELASAKARFGAARFKLDDASIDHVLASGLVDAGEADKAAPLLARASANDEGEASIDITRQRASLAMKRGEPQQAITLLQQIIDARAKNAPPEDTIPFVEGQAKLGFLLGNALEMAGNLPDARKAWTAAVRGWERLMLEQLRRKNLQAAAEATFEVGRLYYLLGRREEGLRKLDEAIAQDEDRDQSYLDSIAFLVQRGESAAALEIYRRALARPARSVSEYVKVYASLWVLDLSRRSSNADPGATAYLKAIAGRKVLLRPPRAADWYTQLARYAVGQIDYQALLGKADTPGERAEAYFYEAMRRLSKGQRAEAHALWSKVVETRMMSFFEFEMASRYLRTGAPARPEVDSQDETI